MNLLVDGMVEFVATLIYPVESIDPERLKAVEVQNYNKEPGP